MSINPAKRGDMFVYPVERCAVYVNGPTDRRTEFGLAVVTSVHRDGGVAAYRRAGETAISKGAPSGLRLLPQTRIDVARAERFYAARSPSWSPEFKTLEEAKAFCREFLREIAS